MAVTFILKNWKWFLGILIVLILGGYITYLNITIRFKSSEIVELQEDIEELTVTNLVLRKDLEQEMNKRKILTNHIESIKFLDTISTEYGLADSVIQGYNMYVDEYKKLYTGLK